jgi:hypothetical protein
MIRSIRAVRAGFAAVVILSIGTDVALRAAGSYIAARLAPSRPMRHALLLGVRGLVAGTGGAIDTWNGGKLFCKTKEKPA